MKHADDMQDRQLDQFAHDLRERAVGAGTDPEPDVWWEKLRPETRALYRKKARAFMAGDLSVMG